MKTIRIFAAVMLVLALMTGSALAQTVTVVNGTGFSIHGLGLADAGSDADAQDLLGDDTLDAGESLQIEISGSSKGWELIAVDGDGTQVNWQNLDLTGVSKITLKADGTATMQ